MSTTIVTHRDFLGNPLWVGDEVVVAPKGYRGLVKATIGSYAGSMLNLHQHEKRGGVSNYRVPCDFVVKVSHR